MIELKRYKLDNCEYPEDVRRIIKVAASMDITLTPMHAEELWKEHSNRVSASWLFLPEHDLDLERIIESFI